MSNRFYGFPIQENAEPLVPLSQFSPKLQVYPFYYHQNIDGATPECFLRIGAAERLEKALQSLPKGYSLVVFDAWRPYRVQLALYNQIKEEFRNKGYSGEQVELELSKFVALPSNNPDDPSPHMTGGAIDLTLAQEGEWVNMGTDFDEFTERAYTTWYETGGLNQQEQEIRDHRRMLCQVMKEAGFVNYEEEWWHFEYGTRRWAGKTIRPFAIYKGIPE